MLSENSVTRGCWLRSCATGPFASQSFLGEVVGGLDAHPEIGVRKAARFKRECQSRGHRGFYREQRFQFGRINAEALGGFGRGAFQP